MVPSSAGTQGRFDVGRRVLGGLGSAASFIGKPTSLAGPANDQSPRHRGGREKLRMAVVGTALSTRSYFKWSRGHACHRTLTRWAEASQCSGRTYEFASTSELKESL